MHIKTIVTVLSILLSSTSFLLHSSPLTCYRRSLFSSSSSSTLLLASTKKRTALVIVESPAKASTIQKLLTTLDPTTTFTVDSSMGHIRDLPQSASQLTPSVRASLLLSRPHLTAVDFSLGVDVSGGSFSPLYLVMPGKEKVIRRLKDLVLENDVVYLATDGDREGEAIAWHLKEVLEEEDEEEEEVLDGDDKRKNKKEKKKKKKKK